MTHVWSAPADTANTSPGLFRSAVARTLSVLRLFDLKSVMCKNFLKLSCESPNPVHRSDRQATCARDKRAAAIKKTLEGVANGMKQPSLRQSNNERHSGHKTKQTTLKQRHYLRHTTTSEGVSGPNKSWEAFGHSHCKPIEEALASSRDICISPLPGSGPWHLSLIPKWWCRHSAL